MYFLNICPAKFSVIKKRIHGTNFMMMMMISRVNLSSAAVVPDTEVGSRRPGRLTPALHPPLLCGLVLPIPHTLKLVLMQSDHDFLGLPRPRALGISMFIIVLVQL